MFMRTGYIYFLCVVFCLMLCSCEKDKQSSVNGDGVQTLLPVGDMNIHPLGDKIEFSYTSFKKWELDISGDNIDISNDDIKVIPSSGNAGTTKITVMVPPNTTGEVKKYELNFGSDDSFKISQEPFKLDLTLTPNEGESIHELNSRKYSVEYRYLRSIEGISLKVDSNVEWKIRIEYNDEDEEWYSIRHDKKEVTADEIFGSASEGLSEEFSILAQWHNLIDGERDPEKRNAVLTVVPCKKGAEIPGLKRTISLSQDNVLFFLESSSDDVIRYDGKGTFEFETPFSALGDEKEISVVYQKDSINIDDWENLVGEPEDVVVNDSCVCCRRKMQLSLPLNMEKADKSESDEGKNLSPKRWSLPIGEGITVDVKCYQEKYIFHLDTRYYNETITRLNTQEQSIFFSSSGQWTLEVEDGEWVEIYAEKPDGSEVSAQNGIINAGSGDWSVLIKAKKPNDAPDDRTAYISIYSDHHGQNSDFKENLTLTQQKYYFEVKKEGADIEDRGSDIVAYGGDDGVVYEFVVNCGAPWEVTSDQGESVVNIDYEKDKADGLYADVPVKLTVSNHDGTGKDRNIEITVKSYKGEGSPEEKSFILKQDKFVFKVEDKFNVKTIVGATDTQEYTLCKVTCTDNAPWSIIPDDDRLKVMEAGSGNVTTKFEGNGKDQYVKFSLEPNYSDEKRHFKVTIENKIINYNEEIANITQEAYVFNANSLHDWILKDAKAVSETYDELSCSGGFADPTLKYAGSDEGWITAEFDETGTKLTVKVQENKGGKRSAELILKSKDYDENATYRKEFFKAITITQPAAQTK